MGEINSRPTENPDKKSDFEELNLFLHCLQLSSIIFSSAVLGEDPWCFYIALASALSSSLSCKTIKKYLSKKQPILAREITLIAFLSELSPFYDLHFLITIKPNNSRAMAPVCGALVHTMFVLEQEKV